MRKQGQTETNRRRESFIRKEKTKKENKRNLLLIYKTVCTAEAMFQFE